MSRYPLNADVGLDEISEIPEITAEMMARVAAGEAVPMFNVAGVPALASAVSYRLGLGDTQRQAHDLARIAVARDGGPLVPSAGQNKWILANAAGYIAGTHPEARQWLASSVDHQRSSGFCWGEPRGPLYPVWSMCGMYAASWWAEEQDHPERESLAEWLAAWTCERVPFAWPRVPDVQAKIRMPDGEPATIPLDEGWKPSPLSCPWWLMPGSRGLFPGVLRGASYHETNPTTHLMRELLRIPHEWVYPREEWMAPLWAVHQIMVHRGKPPERIGMAGDEVLRCRRFCDWGDRNLATMLPILAQHTSAFAQRTPVEVLAYADRLEAYQEHDTSGTKPAVMMSEIRGDLATVFSPVPYASSKHLRADADRDETEMVATSPDGYEQIVTLPGVPASSILRWARDGWKSESQPDPGGKPWQGAARSARQAINRALEFGAEDPPNKDRIRGRLRAAEKRTRRAQRRLG